MGNLRKRERQEDVLAKLELEIAKPDLMDAAILSRGFIFESPEAKKAFREKKVKIKQTDIANLKRKLGK